MSGKRCGYIAILGAPNAGKSTLLNRVVGTKLAIVTPRVQTTRNRILGIAVRERSQLVFLDTPGVFAAKQRFEKAMVASALTGARDADLILLVIDSRRGIDANAEILLEALAHRPADVILVLNKVDAASKETLLALGKEIFERLPFRRTFMISALKGQGVDDLLDYLSKEAPEGPWLFPEDQLTDLSERFLAAEITREKLFLALREELPYHIAVDTEQWQERNDGSVKISQVIYVRSEGQKKIVIGRQGAMLKRVGQMSRQELQRQLERPVHLFLFVKVAENWKDNPEFYQALGLEYKR